MCKRENKSGDNDEAVQKGTYHRKCAGTGVADGVFCVDLCYAFRPSEKVRYALWYGRQFLKKKKRVAVKATLFKLNPKY